MPWDEEQSPGLCRSDASHRPSVGHPPPQSGGPEKTAPAGGPLVQYLATFAEPSPAELAEQADAADEGLRQ
eukprot:6493440-Alexandrium_andersonii.AAC.1